MAQKRRVSILICVMLAPYTCAQQSFVTYVTNGGRFGDELITYAKAKWVSYKNNVPLIYVPFKYSHELMLHTIEQTYPYQKRTLKLVHVYNDQQTPINNNAGVLYVIHYETRLKDWNDWEFNMFPKIYDPGFISVLRMNIQPRNPFAKLPLPQNVISIALHVRKGGGFDQPLLSEQSKADRPINKWNYADVDFPLKFPPDQYYIDQLKYLSDLFKDQPLYVQLFTDDKNPERLVTKYTAALNNPNISFGYRTQGNTHNTHVLEDFFGMTECDCLIRSDSSFSRAADLIGDFKVVIYPEHYIWRGYSGLIIDKVAIKYKEQL